MARKASGRANGEWRVPLGQWFKVTCAIKVPWPVDATAACHAEEGQKDHLQQVDSACEGVVEWASDPNNKNRVQGSLE